MKNFALLEQGLGMTLSPGNLWEGMAVQNAIKRDLCPQKLYVKEYKNKLNKQNYICLHIKISYLR
ncbi:MAG: hypothetical protein IPH36_07810 [Saprospiraceae bacterium]|nr:hypothetical protein [Saprospiraceae bacterium]